MRWVKALARSTLYVRNLQKGFNAWALGVIKYSAGILDWPNDELKEWDMKTRKTLAMNGVFHKKSSVDCLYLKREDNGLELIIAANCVHEEECSLFEYVTTSEKCMLKVVGHTLATGESRWDYKKCIEAERKQKLGDKRLHGKFLRVVQDVPAGRSWQWTCDEFFAKSLEAFIFCSSKTGFAHSFSECNKMRERI